MGMTTQKELQIPEGYEALRLLVGYNDGDITCLQADDSWDQIDDDIDFDKRPRRVVFFIPKQEKEFGDEPIHTFFMKNGVITPYEDPSIETQAETKTAKTDPFLNKTRW